VKFSTLFYDTDIGLISITVDTRLMIGKGWAALSAAAMLWAFSVGIYQIFLFFGALILCVYAIFFDHYQGETRFCDANCK
jgi:hypothetical protein